jgi:hypothetical protein
VNVICVASVEYISCMHDTVECVACVLYGCREMVMSCECGVCVCHECGIDPMHTWYC